MHYVKKMVESSDNTYGHGHGLTCPLCNKPASELDIDTLLCDKCHHRMSANDRKIWMLNVVPKINHSQMYPESEFLVQTIKPKDIFTPDTMFELFMDAIPLPRQVAI